MQAVQTLDSRSWWSGGGSWWKMVLGMFCLRCKPYFFTVLFSCIRILMVYILSTFRPAMNLSKILPSSREMISLSVNGVLVSCWEMKFDLAAVSCCWYLCFAVIYINSIGGAFLLPHSTSRCTFTNVWLGLPIRKEMIRTFSLSYMISAETFQSRKERYRSCPPSWQRKGFVLSFQIALCNLFQLFTSA